MIVGLTLPDRASLKLSKARRWPSGSRRILLPRSPPNPSGFFLQCNESHVSRPISLAGVGLIEKERA
jgi:hypothetical protein